MLRGAYTAMITPFRDGEIDYDRLSENVAYQLDHGIDGLVPVGTTGESPTLSHAEHRRVIEHVVEQAAARVPVIAGTGSNSTAEALELTAHAKSVGADAALLVNPYYNKPDQEGLYRHFMTVADAVDLPIVLYNIPGRTSITMDPRTVARLAEHDNVVAIKEATGSLDIASEIASRCDIVIVSGDDSLTLPLIAIGGRGVISVLSNLVPDRVKSLATAALAGDFDQARKRHYELFGLFKACLSLATNPITIKTAMRLCGRDSGQLRLPLCEMPADRCEQLERLLREAGLREEVA
jgi:4-hydroxy-tetrahydrodipicolinate synthase